MGEHADTGAVSGSARGERTGTDDRWGGVEAWLAIHPEALVAALGADGHSAPMPAGVLLTRGQRIDGRSLLDLVVEGDRPKVATAFMSATEFGLSAVSLRMVGPPIQAVTATYIDMTEELGVFMRLVAPEQEEHSSGSSLPDGISARRRPRLGSCTKDQLARILSVDDAVCAMLGWAPEQMVGRRSLDFIHPDDQGRAIDSWMRLTASGKAQTVRLRHLQKDGAWVWLEISNGSLRTEGSAQFSECQMIDISEEMASSEALRRNELLLRRLVETVPVGMLHLAPDRSVNFSNPTLRELIGADVTDLDHLRARLNDSERGLLDAGLAAAFLEGSDTEFDLTVQAADAPAALRIRVSVSAVVDGGEVAGVLLCAIDVTELKVQATIDPLTGLHNRPSTFGALSAALSRPGIDVGVMFIDLDSFKPINDRYGHDAGDRVLAVVAERLRGAVRKGDEIGRWGGDEFVVVCPDLRDRDEMVTVARRIAAGLQAPMRLSDALEVTLSASLGFATGSSGVATAAQLVSEADASMYAAKHQRTQAAHTQPAAASA